MERRLAAPIIVVVSADHGEEFRDHGGVYHGSTLYEEQIRVPLIVRAPGLAPRRVSAPVQTIDIAPTLMGLLGLPYSAPWFGQDALNTPATGRIAFFSHNHNVALLRDSQLTTLGLRKSVSQAHYDKATDSYTATSADPASEALAIAYYQTAYELFREGRYR